MMTSLLPHLEEERTPMLQRNLLISIMGSPPVRRRRWICVNRLNNLGDILMNPHLGGLQGKFLQTVHMETMLAMQAEGGLLEVQQEQCLLSLYIGVG
jgi:hypothetical protein